MSGKERYVIYQPMHGMGMEAIVLHTAVRLARAMNRTLVVPLVPRPETREYWAGLDEYLEFDVPHPWISTADLLRRVTRIDRLVRVVPCHRPEYLDPIVRATHPVWLDLVERCPYFEDIGLEVHERVDVVIREPRSVEETAMLLDDDSSVLAVSYVNGLLADDDDDIAIGKSHFARRRFAPVVPRRVIFDEVARRCPGPIAIAIHLRRTHVELTKLVRHIELAADDEFLEEIPRDSRLYVASDLEESKRLFGIHHADTCWTDDKNPILAAGLDLAACIAASGFLGTSESTFSQMIVAARDRRGQPPCSSRLLRGHVI